MEESFKNEVSENKPQRPTLLTVLCILTFIGSGMNLFSSFMIAGFYDLFVQISPEIAKEFKWSGIELLTEANPLFFLFSGLFYIGSLIGALFMFFLKKIGFHIYTIAQILLVIAPMYFFHLPGPGTLILLVSGLFIFLYSMNLKFMS
jgi:hypothetical protein